MVGRARVVSDRTSVRLARIAPGLLVFVAATVLVTTHRFDGLYGQDAFGYVNYALGPLRDAFLHGEAIPSFQQPPGFPVAIAAISLVAGPDGRIGLVVSLLAGALVPVMTGLLASEAIGRRVGGGRAVVAVPIAAAVIAALPGQLWQSSAVAMSDTLSVALATTGAWAACRYGRTGTHALASPGRRHGRGRHRHALGLWPRRRAGRRGRASRRSNGLGSRPAPGDP